MPRSLGRGELIALDALAAGLYASALLLARSPGPIELRWLVVAATAHIGATLVSQRAVQVGIRLGVLPESLAHTVDIGVSYGLAGVAGVLVPRVPGPRRWRLAAAAVLLGLFGYPLLTDHTFTDLGHFCAALIGLAFRPVTPAYRGAGLPVSRRTAAPGSPRFRPPRWRR